MNTVTLITFLERSLWWIQDATDWMSYGRQCRNVALDRLRVWLSKVPR
jgi:hypothetical protein